MVLPMSLAVSWDELAGMWGVGVAFLIMLSFGGRVREMGCGHRICQDAREEELSWAWILSG